MRCRTCDYSLWNLKPGPCPECGTPFDPSKYRFRPNAVEFKCPCCSQAYYGTTTVGHLEPSSFDCASCGNGVTLAETIVVPAPGVAEDATGVPDLAWENRARIGLVRAWWRTVIRTLSAPTEAMESIPPTAPLSGPILFAGLTSVLGTTFGAVLALSGLGIGAIFMNATAGNILRLMLIQIAILASNIVFAIIATLLGGFVAHLTLMALRAARGDLARTLQATLYGSGAAYALYIIPCPCVSLAGIPWWCVCLALMYRVAHSTTMAKSVIAMLVALVVSLSATFALALIPQGLGYGSQGMVSFSTGTSSAVTGDDIAEGFTDARAATGAWPRTPLDLVLHDHLSGEHLANMVAMDGGDEVAFGSLAPRALADDDLEAVRAESDRLAALLPADNGVFRLGRSIFVYRGRDAAVEDAWLVIIEPRRHNDGTARNQLWTVVRPDGALRFTTDEIYPALATENARRAAAGLPEIPDPAKVPDLFNGVVPKPIRESDAATPSGPEGESPAAPPVPAPPATEGK